MLKFASFQIISKTLVDSSESKQLALRTTASRAVFNYEPRDGYIYVRSRAISSRCNDNFDEFAADEIAKGYRSFIGKPVFVNHHNENHRRARGFIIDAALHRDRNPDGSPDTWVEVLMEVDAKRFPILAKAVLAGHIDRTSMGVDVQKSECSACGNVASSPSEYCQHIPRMKGQRIYRHDPKTGRRVGELIREKCAGLHFFENSLLVEDPADPTAVIISAEPSGGDVTPRPSGSYGGQRRVANVVPSSDLFESELPSLGVASTDRHLGEKVALDHQDISLGEFAGRIGRSAEAPTSLDHVSGVVSWEAQQPVSRVVAQRGVAGMANDAPLWNGANERHVPPAMRAHAASSRVVQGQPSVSVLKDSARPEVARVLPTARVDLGQVSGQYGSHEGQHIAPTAYVLGVDNGTQKTATKNPASHTQGYEAPPMTDSWSYETPNSQSPGIETLAMQSGMLFDAAKSKPRSEMTPAELKIDDREKRKAKTWLNQHPPRIKHVVDHWNQATDDEKANGESWYEDAYHMTKHIANDTGIPMHAAAGLMTIYSPQTHWATNIMTAARVARTKTAVGGKGSGVLASASQRDKAQRIVDGEHYEKVIGSSGPKTKAFGHLIEHGGNADPNDPKVVIDRHAMSVASGGRLTDRAYAESGISGAKKYKQYADVYHKAAKIISKQEGRKIEAHQVQAATWLARQRLNEQQDRELSKTAGSRSATRARSAIQEFNSYMGEHHPSLMGKEPGTGYSKDAPEDVQHAIDMEDEHGTASQKTAQLLGYAEHSIARTAAGEWTRLDESEYRSRPKAPVVAPKKIVSVPSTDPSRGTSYRPATSEEYGGRAAFHDPSPSDEYHGPYRVIQHAETGKFHVVDNQDRVTRYGPRNGSDEQHQAEMHRDHAEHRQSGKEHARALADQIFNGAMDILDPGGTEDSRRSDRNISRMNELGSRYEGGPHHPLTPGRFGADDHEKKGDGEGQPFYEVKDPGGSGWTARDYGGQNVHIYHEATPDEAHDLIDAGDPELSHKTSPPKPVGYGHEELHQELQHWIHGDPADGEDRYGAGADFARNDPRIQRWQRRKGYTASRRLAYGEVKAPADVDTLRDAECPVCGESSDSYDGATCRVCGYDTPPDFLRDPDLAKAKQLDLRKDILDDNSTPAGVPGQLDPSQLDENGMPIDEAAAATQQLQQVQNTGQPLTPDDLDENGMPVDLDAADRHFEQGGEPFTPGPNAPQPGQPMQQPDEGELADGDFGGGYPGTPEDGVPDLMCPACGYASDASAPQTEDMDAQYAPLGGGGTMIGDACPACGKATMVSASEMAQQQQMMGQ